MAGRSETASAIDVVVLTLAPEDGDGDQVEATVPAVCLSGGGKDDIPKSLQRSFDYFDYGYALTVHKAQGSEWDSVLLIDESRAFRDNRHRWLYTGITRAAKRLTIVRPA